MGSQEMAHQSHLLQIAENKHNNKVCGKALWGNLVRECSLKLGEDRRQYTRMVRQRFLNYWLSNTASKCVQDPCVYQLLQTNV